MKEERTLYQVAAPGLNIDGNRVGIGDRIWSDDVTEGYDWDVLVERGHVFPVKVETVEDDSSPDTTDEDEGGTAPEDTLSYESKGALLDMLADEGVSEADIEGTGTDGAVTRNDVLRVAREVLE